LPQEDCGRAPEQEGRACAALTSRALRVLTPNLLRVVGEHRGRGRRQGARRLRVRRPQVGRARVGGCRRAGGRQARRWAGLVGRHSAHGGGVPNGSCQSLLGGGEGGDLVHVRPLQDGGHLQRFSVLRHCRAGQTGGGDVKWEGREEEEVDEGRKKGKRRPTCNSPNRLSNQSGPVMHSNC
jgi:hypothetical protein